ncbi:MtnX-like HAD-IB family phosphatase [Natranaerobius thermophilus]|uniref:2,3-diketo-5-methylthio-1-phosphopentane phosphatase n=1 Tax=Natranaerobius thermophilus (strain ATCC BAA-1301 / DSM 18059 / JW/NM-WN-LF) TaxID=457570 RepID=B2A2V6_NATTJ|nr:MtnX-like HAD-IB family phosphatase [Natranaerobius thermophilus]ACB86324.1 2,3-diketo-5-methylthio-1-phosphopentane phosphatase [Natranaerobius thermophilus JW/NM-WN-LF]
MSKDMDLNQLAVITDFDGTITSQDTNDLIIDNFGTETNQEVERLFQNSKIGTREAMKRHFKEIKILENQYSEFLLQNTEVRTGFKSFTQICMKHKIPLYVVSGGFTNIIEKILHSVDPLINSYARIYANQLHFNKNNISITFYHDSVNCIKDFGPCGNCKRSHVKNLQAQHKQVIFIGDGLTDRCGAETSDLVFARSNLAEFCREHGISFYNFKDFNDVQRQIFNIFLN